MRYFLVAQYTYCKYIYIYSVYVHTIYNTVAYKKNVYFHILNPGKTSISVQHCWGWGWIKTSWEVFGSVGLSFMNRPMSIYILVWCYEVDFLLCFVLFLPFFVGWYKETTFQSLELWDNISNKIPNFSYFVMKHASTSSFHFVFSTSFFKKMIFQKYLQK